jgi:hypothetical protein
MEVVCVEYYCVRVRSMWGRGCFVCVYVFCTDGFMQTCFRGSCI